jgi:hypothetical protein
VFPSRASVIAGSLLALTQSVGAQPTGWNGHATIFGPPVEIIDGIRGPGGRWCAHPDTTGWIVVDVSDDGAFETAIKAECTPGRGGSFAFPVRFSVLRGPHTGRQDRETWQIDCYAPGGQFQMTGPTIREEQGAVIQLAEHNDPPERWYRPGKTDRGLWQILKWACDRVGPFRRKD